ncbi:MAG: BNR-4 repeat-containing protein [Clostridia bacterium]|nr:BNR-4 repeat-containing protein [Clostridia bacterium]
MKKIISTVLAVCMIIAAMANVAFAEIAEHNFTATACGHSGSATGTGLFIGAVGTSGSVDCAPYISGITGNNSVKVASARVGALEFMVDGSIDPEAVKSAVLNIHVNSVNGNLGSGWMLLAAYETQNPKLTYSTGGMDRSLYPAINDDYSYEAAFWTNEKCSKSSLGWKTMDVTRAVVNALKKDNGESEEVRVVLRLQVPAAGLNVSVEGNTPYITVSTGELVEGVVKFCDNSGNKLSDDIAFTAIEGSYRYTGEIEQSFEKDGYFYVYDASASLTEITLSEGGENTVKIVYQKCSADDFYSGDVLIERGATCWFADPRSVTFKHDDIYENGELVLPASSKTLVGAIDTDGTVKAIQYDNLTGKAVNVVLDTNFQADDHNNPTFLYLPDKRIMVLWAGHTMEPYWYYRVSQVPDDITTLGEEKRVSVEGYGNYTYPSPFYMTDAPDSFFLCWRGVSWHPTIAKYSLPDADDNIVCEIKPTQIVDSVGARPYVKYESNGKDRIYFTFTTAHPDNANPNWVYYSELDINTLNLYNIEGDLLCTGNNLPYGKDKNINTSTDYGSLTVDNPSNNRDWVWDVCKDGDQNPVILFTRLSSDKRQHDYYYGKWNPDKKIWEKTFIADGGKWFHQNANSSEKCYSGGMCLDHSDPSVLYLSKPTAGFYGDVYEIWKIEMDGVKIKSETQITKNSRYNNVRPFMAWGADSENDRISLTWMNGLYYYWIVSDSLPDAFPTSIMMHGEAPEFDYNYGLEKISLPEYLTGDIPLPEITFDGAEITWTSSDESIVTRDGLVYNPESEESVTLTATTPYGERQFNIRVPARDITKNNVVLKYEFEENDIYTKDNTLYVKDKSGKGNDGVICGGASVTGVLDLSANTSDFDTNGYASAPGGVLDNLRSYSIALRIKAEHFDNQPRFYDFGKDTGNSLFLRGDGFAAGVKHNNATTAMLSPSISLEAGKEYFLAVTYDAKSGVTRIYIDSKIAGEGTNLKIEPYLISGSRNYIGRTQWWNTSVGDDNMDFCGTIDDFTLFDVALTEQEIAEISNKVKIVSVIDENGLLTVTSENAPGNALIVVACYTSENEMISADVYTQPFAVSSDAAMVKVFCMESYQSLKPLCKCEVILTE